jgi:hypothetical protein
VAATSTANSTPGDTGIISALSARSIKIEGSLIGGTAGTGTNTNGTLDQTADTSGAILVNSVTSLTIGNNITGGTGPNSGIITGQSAFAAVSFGNIVVNGGITGGSGDSSGAILANGLFGGKISSVHIGTSLTGSSGTQSGEVYALTSLGTFFVGGNVMGGTANNSGEIYAGTNLTSGIIKGNLIGNTAIDSSSAVVGSGYLQFGEIGSLNISGNVTSGANSGTGGLADSGAIRSAGGILALTIGGEVTGTAADPVVISATQGKVNSMNPKGYAINSATFGGAVSYLDLLAGYNTNVSTTTGGTTHPAGAPLGTPVNGSAQIDTVTFLSTLSASNVVAGVEPDSSGNFGTTGNKGIPINAGALHSSIASIIVDGHASGDSNAADSFGFVADTLGSVTANGATVSGADLKPGTPVLVTGTTNLYLLEVSPVI